MRAYTAGPSRRSAVLGRNVAIGRRSGETEVLAERAQRWEWVQREGCCLSNFTTPNKEAECDDDDVSPRQRGGGQTSAIRYAGAAESLREWPGRKDKPAPRGRR
ncbi:hypothetical protein HPB48_019696 [Haemaphysalis longicornis]|uniref:Uncharacterized protein n=1 Tax=Haemaphysalis longicornis TaxID=44386 RepID=A0A9J6G443_HAELO|nr:hypothetical protein HPB48_019696 [Haemaphysalis longicornis]